jgi:hypothetical protein
MHVRRGSEEQQDDEPEGGHGDHDTADGKRLVVA